MFSFIPAGVLMHLFRPLIQIVSSLQPMQPPSIKRTFACPHKHHDKPQCATNECSCFQAKVHIKFIISIPRTESHCQAHAAIASMPLVLFSSSSTFPLSPNPGIYFAKSFNVKGLASSSLRYQYPIKKRSGDELTSIPNLLHHTQHHFLRRRLLHCQK
jgi:hypothetical protein